MFWPTGGIAHRIPPSQLIFIMNRGVSWPPPRSMVLQDAGIALPGNSQFCAAA